MNKEIQPALTAEQMQVLISKIKEANDIFSFRLSFKVGEVFPKSKDDFVFRSSRFTSCCRVAPSGGCSQCVHLDRRLELQKEQKKEQEEEEEEDKGKYKWLRIAQTNQLPRQAGARGM